MQINYRPMPSARLVSLGVVSVGLIVMSIWYFVHWGTPRGLYGGRVVIAPFAGILFLAMMGLTINRNRSYRLDPMLLNCDSDALTVHKGGERRSYPWREVGEVGLVRSKANRPPTAISIAVRDDQGGTRRLVFDQQSMQLGGRKLTDLVAAIEAARRGASEVLDSRQLTAQQNLADRSAAARADRAERVERTRERGRTIGWVIVVGYWVALSTLVFSTSGQTTTMLTGGAGLTRDVCIATGLITSFGLLVLLMVPANRRADQIPNPRAKFKVIVIMSLMGGVLATFAAYPFARAYENHHLFSGPGLTHETRRFPITRAYLNNGRERHVVIDSDGGGLSSLFGEAVFEVMPEDWARLKQRSPRSNMFHPNRGTTDPLCIALPVEVSGNQIRAVATYSPPLPEGSVLSCT